MIDKKQIDGSEPLLNRKHEEFCQHVVDGANHEKAAHLAGYDSKSKHGHKLANREDIRNRIDFLFFNRIRVSQDIGWKLQEELSVIAFADLTEFVEQDKQTGEINVRPFEKINPRYRRAINKIKCTKTTIPQIKGEDKVVVQTEIALWDKHKGIDQLLKIYGFNKDLGQIRGWFRRKGCDVHYDAQTNKYKIIDLVKEYDDPTGMAVIG